MSGVPRRTRTPSAAALVLVLPLCACRTNGQVRDPSTAANPDANSSHAGLADAEVQTEVQTEPSAGIVPAALTRQEIRVVVRAKMSEVRACFDAGLARTPGIGGRVLLRFTIGAEGRAGAITIVEDELTEPAVAACLSETLTRWQFPRPRGGAPVTIAYPFVFSSEASLRAAGLPRVEGTVKPAAVGAVFEARRPELDDCVPEAAKGTIGLAFTIDDGGAVTRISTYENTLDDHARGCVVQAVSSWVFPPAAGGDEARVNHDLWW